ncbi:cation:proton antiporter [Frondihabitans australicus]|uniref:CPA1 family monovalent cation:H+ antiporter n=1 Tax=Frondihabitans australicus TaxID=386892 RepID=A0A495IKQ3_9MICO|nr:sodium:proton antiporter [Frondihabitans australicus]RKR76523.1 CPA1 family monovalent cation:H+ antiporter [Frondihabitans australicus]
MELLIIGVLGLVAIAAATAFEPRIGIATPLLLTLLGIGVSLLPISQGLHVDRIDPEWILAGVLPPLLYSSSVAMPTMNFRREFGAIGGLSVALVIVSAVLLGLFFHLVIPGLPLAWAIALGAIISPTDAVATGIIKKVGVSSRVTAILEGESLLNDATALVTLKSAIAAVAAGFQFGGAIGTFAYSVAVAVAIGWAVGLLNLYTRRRVQDATVNTAISIAAPFVASIPAEMLQASGLVAAVVAGLVTGTLAPRLLSPQHRLSDAQNWRTIELVLEGALFLVTGLQMTGLAAKLSGESTGVAAAIGIAAGALVLTILIRAAYVGPLLFLLRKNAQRGEALKERITSMQAKIASGGAITADDRITRKSLAAGEQKAIEAPASATPPQPSIAAAQTSATAGTTGSQEPGDTPADESLLPSRAARPERRARTDRTQRGEARMPSPSRMAQFNARLRRGLADIEYFLQAPLGWKEGTILVWAGMRGAVTLAAAETLGASAPHQALLVFLAFVVAVGSLLLQGGTIGWLVGLLKPAKQDPALALDERTKLFEMMRSTANDVLDGADPNTLDRDGRLKILHAQRAALLDARDDGTFSADMLGYVLESLDADEIAISMRGGPGT